MLEIERRPSSRTSRGGREMFHTLFRLGFRELLPPTRGGSVHSTSRHRARPLWWRNRPPPPRRPSPRRSPARSLRIETARCRRRVFFQRRLRRGEGHARRGANRPPERFIAIPRTASSVGVSGGRRAAICCSSLAEKSVSEKAAIWPIFSVSAWRRKRRATPNAALGSLAPSRSRCLLLARALTDTDSVPRARSRESSMRAESSSSAALTSASDPPPPAETAFFCRGGGASPRSPSSPSSPSAPPGAFASRAEETACLTGPGGGRPHETHARRCRSETGSRADSALAAAGAGSLLRCRFGGGFLGAYARPRPGLSSSSQPRAPGAAARAQAPPESPQGCRRRTNHRARRRRRRRRSPPRRLRPRRRRRGTGDARAIAVRAWHPANPRPAIARSGRGDPASKSRGRRAARRRGRAERRFRFRFPRVRIRVLFRRPAEQLVQAALRLGMDEPSSTRGNGARVRTPLSRGAGAAAARARASDSRAAASLAGALEDGGREGIVDAAAKWDQIESAATRGMARAMSPRTTGTRRTRPPGQRVPRANRRPTAASTARDRVLRRRAPPLPSRRSASGTESPPPPPPRRRRDASPPASSSSDEASRHRLPRRRPLRPRAPGRRGPRARCLPPPPRCSPRGRARVDPPRPATRARIACCPPPRRRPLGARRPSRRPTPRRAAEAPRERRGS